MTEKATAQMTMTAAALLSPDEVATRLHVSRDNVFKLMRAGELAYVRVGRFYRVTEADLADFVARHRHSAGALAVAIRPPRTGLRRSAERNIAL